MDETGFQIGITSTAVDLRQNKVMLKLSNLVIESG